MSQVSEEFAELDHRTERAIVRIRDRLSTPEGERIRADWAREFARLLGGEVMPVRMLACLRLPAHMLTDPVVVRVFTGYVVLDHPEAFGAFEWAFQQFSTRIAIYDCARWWSLYEKRHPRLIACPDRGKVVQLPDLIDRVGYTWHGPFEAPPTWEFAQGSSPSSPFRSLVRVEHSVADEWFERI
jgi:hypothetical protein